MRASFNTMHWVLQREEAPGEDNSRRTFFCYFRNDVTPDPIVYRMATALAPKVVTRSMSHDHYVTLNKDAF